MSKFMEFIKQVAKHTFLGADNIAKTGGVIALFIASFKFPELPWWASVGLLVVLIFYGTYKAWREERQNKITLERQLADLHDQIPQFTISKGAVRKYSVSNLIEHYEQQAEGLKTPPAPVSTGITSPFSAATAALMNATQSIGLAAQLAGMETNEGKIARIEEHAEKLRALEDALSCTYFVELDIKANRSDSHVEIALTAAKHAIFIIEDQFVEKFIPVMEEPRHSLMGTVNFDRFHLADYQLPNIKKSRDDLHLGYEDGIEKTFDRLNANRKTNLFSEELWIQSLEDTIDLEVTIHSEKRREPQVINLSIPVSGVSVEQVEKEE